jgi:hypothetical protein
MAGALYIWIMAAFFLGCGGVVGLIVGILLLGHWLEKKQTGATHGFLELPMELRNAAPRPGSPNGSDEAPPPPGQP